MSTLINAAFSRPRLVLLVFFAVLVFGTNAYVTIPRESSPAIAIPTIYVVSEFEGASATDTEKLLLKPLEMQLGTLRDLKKLEGIAADGSASLILEFLPGTDTDIALDHVRNRLATAKSDLPEKAKSPVAIAINTELFPILTIMLSGPLPEKQLGSLATELKDRVARTRGVLQAEISGTRPEMLEVLVSPEALRSYNLGFDALISQLERSKVIAAAGKLGSERGSIQVGLASQADTAADLMRAPVIVRDGQVLTLSDIATARRSFENRQGHSRLNGQPTIAVEVSKRGGANILTTVAAIKAAVEEVRSTWPVSVRVDYLFDESQQIQDVVSDLEANIIAAIVLVLIAVLYALGPRSSLLVCLSIPGSFLGGVGLLWVLGYTLNIVVLFSLILVVGLLVDGAIVTTELADRNLQRKPDPFEAFRSAAKTMAWPLISSTATTLCVFFPLLFWRGTIGEFMKFLPVTVILVLSVSLAMALIFIPVLGSLIGRRGSRSAAQKSSLFEAEHGDPRRCKGATGRYARVLAVVLEYPGTTVLLAVAFLLGSLGLYARFNHGSALFPSIEPQFVQIQLRSTDSYSVYGRDRIVREVEHRLLRFHEVQRVYSDSHAEEGDTTNTIGTFQLELAPWNTRRPATAIIQDIRADLGDLVGFEIEIETDDESPVTGKPVELRVSAKSPTSADSAVSAIRQVMADQGAFVDIADTRHIPGLEWRIAIDHAKAARSGADAALLLQSVQFLTDGVLLGRYHPSDSRQTLDVRLRPPPMNRNLDTLMNLTVPTDTGHASLSNFVELEPLQRKGIIRRLDQRRIEVITAEFGPDGSPDKQTERLRASLQKLDLPPDVTWTFAGDAEEQDEAEGFLSRSFVLAIVLMFVVLLAQFNRFSQTLIVMSAIAFSSAGVLLGQLVTGQPFGIVMGGIGMIALSGIVVNTNIVLIDTYNTLRRSGQCPLEAALRSGVQRLRAIMLTTVTTILGLLPMVFGMNLNILSRLIEFGAPSTQWWTELSASIVGGLVVATPLTLLTTPAMLVLSDRRRTRP